MLSERCKTPGCDSYIGWFISCIKNLFCRNKHIFFKEIITLCSRHLDLLHHLDIYENEESHVCNCAIMIEPDRNNRTLTFVMKGISVINDDVNDLQTLESMMFMETVRTSIQPLLVGLFDIRLCTAYLVADKMTIISKNSYFLLVWEIKADGTFTYEHTNIRSGSKRKYIQFVLYLNEDQLEYLEEDKVMELVKRYSHYVTSPTIWKSEPLMSSSSEDEDEDTASATANRENLACSTQHTVRDEEDESPILPDIEASSSRNVYSCKSSVNVLWQRKDVHNVLLGKNGLRIAIMSPTKEPDKICNYFPCYNVEHISVRNGFGRRVYKVSFSDTDTETDCDIDDEDIIVGEDINDGDNKNVTKNSNDTDNRTDNRTDNHMDSSMHNDMISDTYSDMVSDTYSDTDSDTDNDTDSDTDSDTDNDNDNYNDNYTDNDNDYDNDTDNDNDNYNDTNNDNDNDNNASNDNGKNYNNDTDNDNDNDNDNNASNDNAAHNDEDTDISSEKLKISKLQWSSMPPYLRFLKRVCDSAYVSSKRGLTDDGREELAVRRLEFLDYLSGKGTDNKLMEMLRFYTSKSGDDWCMLNDYVGRMKEKQKYIYYIVGEDRKVLQTSSFIEGLVKRGIEVIYMTDQFVVSMIIQQRLNKYRGKRLRSVHRTVLRLPMDKDQRRNLSRNKVKFFNLCRVIKGILHYVNIHDIVVTTRMVDSPCCITLYNFEERNRRTCYPNHTCKCRGHIKSVKVLEINPDHVIIEELQKQADAGKNDEKFINYVHLMYDFALFVSNCITFLDYRSNERYLDRINKKIIKKFIEREIIY